MKTHRNRSLILFIALILTFSFVISVSADGDKAIFNTNYTLRSGQSLDGNLSVFGGTVTIEDEAYIDGNVVVFKGDVFINGIIDGDLAVFGGTIELGDNAVIDGNFSSFGGTVKKSAGATIGGDVVQQKGFELNIGNGDNRSDVKIPFSDVPVKEKKVTVSLFSAMFAFFTSIISFFIIVFIFTGVSMLAHVLFEKQLIAAAHTLQNKVFLSLAVGLLVIVIIPIIMIILSITIILIPVVILLAIALVIACLYGWVTVGYWFGQQLAKSLKVNWAPIWTTATGTLIMTIGLLLFAKIPCIGWIPQTLVSLVGLGAVTLYHYDEFQARSGKSSGAGAILNASPVPYGTTTPTEGKISQSSAEDHAKETAQPVIIYAAEPEQSTQPTEQPAKESETLQQQENSENNAEADEPKGLGATFLDSLHDE